MENFIKEGINYKIIETETEIKMICLSRDTTVITCLKSEEETNENLTFNDLSLQTQFKIEIYNPTKKKKEDHCLEFLFYYILTKITKRKINIKIAHFDGDNQILIRTFIEFLKYLFNLNNLELIHDDLGTTIRYNDDIIYKCSTI